MSATTSLIFPANVLFTFSAAVNVADFTASWFEAGGAPAVGTAFLQIVPTQIIVTFDDTVLAGDPWVLTNSPPGVASPQTGICA